MRILTTLCFVLSAFLSSAQYQVLPRTVDTLTVCDTNTMVVRFKCIVPGSFSTRFHLSRLSVAYPTGSYELSSPGFAIAQAGNAEYLISDTLPHQAGDTVVLPLRLIPNCNTIPNNDVSGTASLTTAFRFGTVSDSITHLCLYSNFSFNGSQTLTFNPNSVTPLKAVFKNNTGTAFHGYFHWNWLRPNVACDTFFKLSTEVRVQVFDSLGVSLAPPRGFATLYSGSYFNGGLNPPAVPPGGSLIVSVADTTIANCSAFTALNVGCPFVLSAA
ncbi:MAG: hypothetical protein U0T73_03385 [Chitinophagales bacterium]